MQNNPSHTIPFNLGIKHPKLKSKDETTPLIVGVVFLGFTFCSESSVGLYINIVGLDKEVVVASITTLTLLLNSTESTLIFNSLGSELLRDSLQSIIMSSSNFTKVTTLVSKAFNN
jgi:hypothetical protein